MLLLNLLLNLIFNFLFHKEWFSHLGCGLGLLCVNGKLAAVLLLHSPGTTALVRGRAAKGLGGCMALRDSLIDKILYSRHTELMLISKQRTLPKTHRILPAACIANCINCSVC
jgi:hypothetical protein